MREMNKEPLISVIMGVYNDLERSNSNILFI